MTMKSTFTLLTTLLLSPLATLNLARALSEVPRFGKLRASSFEALENRDAMTSNDWN